VHEAKGERVRTGARAGGAWGSRLSVTEGLARPVQKDYEDAHVQNLALLSPGCLLMSASLAPALTDVAALSFEDALAELEKIVRGLESGQQKLEEAITAFERGSALRRHCEAKLAEAETRIQAIVERADGALDTRPIA
jgi:exodeoxyribonuclease VII small subunit